MDLGAGPGPVMVDAQPEYKVDHILHASMELAVEDASLLELEDGMIVKHSGCPKLS